MTSSRWSTRNDGSRTAKFHGICECSPVFNQSEMAIERRSSGAGSSARSGTLTVAAAALRVSLRGRDRVGPYGLAGIAAGVWRSNVTDVFPNPVTTGVRAPFFGGGIQVPLADRVTFFADYRMMLVVGEDADELFAVSPIRAGLAWHF